MIPATWRDKSLVLDVVIIVSIVAAIAISVFSVLNGLYDTFEYVYLIPVVLIAYTRPHLGIYLTVLLGWIYLTVVYAYEEFDPNLLTDGTIWFYIFVSIGVVICAYAQENRHEKEMRHQVYHKSQAGVFSFDPDSFAITEVNQKFARLLGYDPRELQEKTLGDIFPGSTERTAFLEELWGKKQVSDFEGCFQRKDGGFAWALLSATLAEEPGAVIICSVVDISKNKKAEEALQQANRRLNLLNNVTRHDILNQMTGLLGYIQLSRQKISDPEILTYIAKEEQAAETIRTQILFTRDYQNIGIHSPQWFHVAETSTLSRATLDMNGISVTCDLEGLEIYADPLLEKVFYNLFENSLRHGDHVTAIRMTGEETDSGYDIVYEDNGAGIPGDAKERIFLREYYKNTGFGLFLSREILAITGLTIIENGTQGTGARFVIHAPRGTFRKSNR
ncbi:MAG: PAS domain S-box protein [Methanoregulaceae archaeon]